MQIDPLFHDDLEGLKSALRLSGSDEKGDVQTVIEDCVRGFKVWLIQRAGFTVVSDLQAVVYTDDPTTELEARRMAARVLEVKWVWCECLTRLQTMFADASGAAFQEFNDQGVWRQLDEIGRIRILRQCQREVEDLYNFVSGCQGIGETESVQCFDGTTERTEAFFPAGSVFCHLGKFPGNFLVPSVKFDAEILRPNPETP